MIPPPERIAANKLRAVANELYTVACLLADSGSNRDASHTLELRDTVKALAERLEKEGQ